MSHNNIVLSVNLESSYWILDTDYKNFAVAFSCHNVGGFASASMYITYMSFEYYLQFI